MKFKITDNPNYEENKRKQLEIDRINEQTRMREQEKKEQELREKKEQMVTSCLDKVQYALDTQQYTNIPIRGASSLVMKSVSIVLGQTHPTATTINGLDLHEVMSEVAKRIKKKVPTWKVIPFTPNAYDWHGTYGIRITGLKKDFD